MIYTNISKVGILIYWFIGIKIREQRIQRINTWIKTMSYKYLGKHKGYASPRWGWKIDDAFTFLPTLRPSGALKCVLLANTSPLPSERFWQSGTDRRGEALVEKKLKRTSSPDKT